MTAPVNEQAMDWMAESAPDGTAKRFRKKLGAAAGGRAIGASIYRMPPGEKPWPKHFHTANEEAIYVLAGEGALALGDAVVPLRAGDYVALPPDAAHAHQVRNDSDADFVFLCISTMNQPDVLVYPDSGKVGVFCGAAPGGPPQEMTLRKFLSLGGEVDYWKGE
jgi:uncharacterized cupin superfamily protein